MQKVILVCGVSGSGKSWVCRQLRHKFHYIPHDEHYSNLTEVISQSAQSSPRPIVTECPFGERVLREALEKQGIQIVPYFVIEPPEKVQMRYHQREGKPLPKAAFTRAGTIINRANEWNAPRGTSDEVLQLLSAL